MDSQARNAVNLNVLKRHDPNITTIIDSSSHVVVYDFVEQNQSWTKKGVEGSMFVFERTVEPYYGFFIMNRLGVQNFVVDLTKEMEFQLMGAYVIYQTSDDKIHGLWMYEESDRTRIAKTLQTCCTKRPDPPQVNVMDMLRNAVINQKITDNEVPNAKKPKGKQRKQPSPERRPQQQQQMTNVPLSTIFPQSPQPVMNNNQNAIPQQQLQQQQPQHQQQQPSPQMPQQQQQQLPPLPLIFPGFAPGPHGGAFPIPYGFPLPFPPPMPAMLPSPHHVHPLPHSPQPQQPQPDQSSANNINAAPSNSVGNSTNNKTFDGVKNLPDLFHRIEKACGGWSGDGAAATTLDKSEMARRVVWMCRNDQVFLDDLCKSYTSWKKMSS